MKCEGPAKAGLCAHYTSLKESLFFQKSLKSQIVHIGEIEIVFEQGESIWTESSYKYTLKQFAQLAQAAGWKVEQVWTDPQEFFSMQYLIAR